MVSAFSCPACGAPHQVSNPGVLMSVCEYCGNAVVVDGDAVEDLGKQSTLSEGFTRLYRGATGTLYGKRFYVLGRARYSFGHGFWDEWFVDFADGDTAWITEDNHELALQRPVTKPSLPPFATIELGARLDLARMQYVVHERGTAHGLGIEGELPKRVDPKASFDYVDASTLDGLYVLGVEYRANEIRAFTGRWVRHDALMLDDPGDGF